MLISIEANFPALTFENELVCLGWRIGPLGKKLILEQLDFGAYLFSKNGNKLKFPTFSNNSSHAPT